MNIILLTYLHDYLCSLCGANIYNSYTVILSVYRYIVHIPLHCPYTVILSLYRYIVCIPSHYPYIPLNFPYFATLTHDILNSSYVDSTRVIRCYDRVLTRELTFDLRNFHAVNESRLKLAVNAMYLYALFLFAHWIDRVIALSETEANVTPSEL